MQPYTFDTSVNELLDMLAKNSARRRLEQGLSRRGLSALSGVPEPTIVRFELQHKISLESFVAISKALGYTDEIKSLLAQPKYSTMEELERLNKNKNRKRGRYETNR